MQTLLSNLPPMLSITKEEIYRAIFITSLLNGPDYNRILIVVWQITWPVLGSYLVRLFEESFL